LGAFIVGAFLYWRYPILYLGFNWWVWFLAPLLTRIVEYQNGWTGSGLRFIILSPYLVTMLTTISFIQSFAKVRLQHSLPFILGFISILYALLIGVVSGNPIVEIGQAVLSWLPAIFFGFHLLANWRDYPQYRQNMQRTFCWGVLVMGIYGILQYVFAPEWDRFWLTHAEDLQLCCGQPAPLKMRVWSTLNFPFTFAYAMMAGLLLLLNKQKPLEVTAIVAGFMAFLLSEVRAAWGGWFIGFVLVLTSLKPSYKVRLIAAVLMIGLCVYPLTKVEPFSEAIASRFQTVSNVQEDQSFNERVQIYGELVNTAVGEVIGRGLGGQKIVDAGPLDVIATLGWFGVVPYIGGVALIFLNLFQYAETRLDPFMNASRAIVLSIFAVLPATNTMVLLPGVMFWGFAGIAMAAHKYHVYQRVLTINSTKSSTSSTQSKKSSASSTQPEKPSASSTPSNVSSTTLR
jgi:hypothetical protein